MEKLHAFRLTPQNLPALAAFMARARPQWWDEAGAAGQLSGTELTPPAGFYAANCFYTAAWKWSAAAFSNRAASF